MNDHWLSRLITQHLGITDPDKDFLAGIRAIVEHINQSGRPWQELVDADGARTILGLGSIGSLRVTMSRDKDFPKPAITGSMWWVKDIEQYREQREARGVGVRGRPPASAQRHEPQP